MTKKGIPSIAGERQEVKRCIAAVTAASFLFSFVLAEPVEAVVALQSERGVSGGSLIPRSCGTITSSRDFGGDLRVISIQDLHCNPEVQKNIGAILKSLDETYGLEKVYVEGGYGQIDTSWLESVPGEGLRRKIAGALVGSGRLTGSEYYSIISGKPRLLEGLEDERLHKENIVRLETILEQKRSFEAVTRTLDNEIALLKARNLSPRNKKFNALLKAYRDGEITPKKYYAILRKYVRHVNARPDSYHALFTIRMEDYPNTAAYLELLDSGARLRDNRIAGQLSACLLELRSVLPFAEYDALVRQAGNGNETDRLCESLSRVVRDRGIDLTGRYPDLAGFLAHLEKKKSVNPVRLMREEERLIEALRIAFSDDVSEVEISFLADFYETFKDYLFNRLSSGDYEYFLSRFDKFRDLWAKYTYSGRLKELEPWFPVLDEYYRVNDERTGRFVDRILQDRAPPNVVVMVTGGFHSEGLQKLLEQRRVSYCTITPNIAGDTAGSADVYRKIVREQATLFSRQALSQTVYSQLMPEVSPDGNGFAIRFRTGEHVRVDTDGGTIRLRMGDPREFDAPAPSTAREMTDAASYGARAASETVARQMSVIKEMLGLVDLVPGTYYSFIMLVYFLASRGWLPEAGLSWDIAQSDPKTQEEILDLLTAEIGRKVGLEDLAGFPAHAQDAVFDHAQRIKRTARRIPSSRNWVRAVNDLYRMIVALDGPQERETPGARPAFITAQEHGGEKALPGNTLSSPRFLRRIVMITLIACGIIMLTGAIPGFGAFSVARALISAPFLLYPITYFIGQIANLRPSAIKVFAGKTKINTWNFANKPLTEAPDSRDVSIPVTIMIPVYKESFAKIRKTLDEALEAAGAYNGYAVQTAGANVVVCDDAIMVWAKNDLDGLLAKEESALTKEEAEARKNIEERLRYYREKGIGFVVRPAPDARLGTQRKGAFPKASNLNHALRMDDLLDRVNGTEKAHTVTPVVLGTLRGENEYAYSYAEGDVKINELILMLDKDSITPRDILLSTVPEFVRDPFLAYTQHRTQPSNSGENFFSRIIGSFTHMLYDVAIPGKVMAGGHVPFVGHNGFVRKSALKKAGYWNENCTSEDLDFSLSVQALGYHGKYLAFEGQDFGEEVTRTPLEEFGKYVRYSFGVFETVFNPLREWRTKGVLTPTFSRYLKSPHTRWYWVLDQVFYFLSYFNLASILPASVVTIILFQNSIFGLAQNLAVFAVPGSLLLILIKLFQQKKGFSFRTFAKESAILLAQLQVMGLVFTAISTSVLKGFYRFFSGRNSRFAATNVDDIAVGSVRSAFTDAFKTMGPGKYAILGIGGGLLAFLLAQHAASLVGVFALVLFVLPVLLPILLHPPLIAAVKNRIAALFKPAPRSRGETSPAMQPVPGIADTLSAGAVLSQPAARQRRVMPLRWARVIGLAVSHIKRLSVFADIPADEVDAIRGGGDAQLRAAVENAQVSGRTGRFARPVVGSVGAMVPLGLILDTRSDWGIVLAALGLISLVGIQLLAGYVARTVSARNSRRASFPVAVLVSEDGEMTGEAQEALQKGYVPVIVRRLADGRKGFRCAGAKDAWANVENGILTVYIKAGDEGSFAQKAGEYVCALRGYADRQGAARPLKMIERLGGQKIRSREMLVLDGARMSLPLWQDILVKSKGETFEDWETENNVHAAQCYARVPEIGFLGRWSEGLKHISRFNRSLFFTAEELQKAGRENIRSLRSRGARVYGEYPGVDAREAQALLDRYGLDGIVCTDPEAPVSRIVPGSPDGIVAGTNVTASTEQTRRFVSIRLDDQDLPAAVRNVPPGSVVKVHLGKDAWNARRISELNGLSSSCILEFAGEEIRDGSVTRDLTEIMFFGVNVFSLLQPAPRTPEEKQEYQRRVAYGLEIGRFEKPSSPQELEADIGHLYAGEYEAVTNNREFVKAVRLHLRNMPADDLPDRFLDAVAERLRARYALAEVNKVLDLADRDTERTLGEAISAAARMPSGVPPAAVMAGFSAMRERYTQTQFQAELRRVTTELREIARNGARDQARFVTVDGVPIAIAGESQALAGIIELIKLYAEENARPVLAEKELAPLRIDATQAILEAA